MLDVIAKTVHQINFYVFLDKTRTSSPIFFSGFPYNYFNRSSSIFMTEIVTTFFKIFCRV